MKVDIDRRQFDDKHIVSLISRDELTVEYGTGRPSASETAAVQKYHPDAQLSLFFFMTDPEEGDGYLKLTLSGEAILPYVRDPDYSSHPMKVLLSNIMQPLTHKYWVTLDKIRIAEEMVGTCQKVVCYQGEETEQVSYDNWKLRLTNVADLARSDETSAPTDAIANFTMAHVKTVLLTLSEQALVGALRTEDLGEDVRQRIMTQYRLNVKRNLTEKVKSDE
jgi:hypothetical protein